METNKTQQAETAALPEIIRALGYDSAPAFGPLWSDASFVMKCLRRYVREEGHEWAIGRSVGFVANEFAYHCPHDGTGEEHSAIACLILLDCSASIVS